MISIFVYMLSNCTYFDDEVEKTKVVMDIVIQIYIYIFQEPILFN